AEVLAQAAGGTLGKLVYLTSGVSLPPGRESPGYAVLTSSASGGMPTPIMPGELTVAAVANARWLFVSR
ncbi:MAG: SIMPL domain-containing protein, partial [Burkholderiaceae bacterium]